MTARHLHWALWSSLLCGLGSPPLAASEPRQLGADALLGEWWTENREGRISFGKAPDGTFRGTTTCCTPARPGPDRPAQDIHNPDPKLRGRSTVGIVIIWNLAYDDGEYSGGYVYNPRDGETYRFAAQLIDDRTLKVRGYLGIPLLGQTQLWQRAAARREADAR